MDENPYRSPEAPVMAEAVGVLSGSREDLRLVAKYQRGLLICILIYLVSGVVSRLVPPEIMLIVASGVLVAAIAGLVFVFLLSTKVYGTGAGVILGILTLIPCIGLIVLLVINQKATGVLRQNKIKVGLLGADPNSI